MRRLFIPYLFISYFALNCSSQNNDKDIPATGVLKEQVATMESPKESEIPIADSNTINCIIINNDSIYCYRGNDLQTGTYYAVSGKNQYRIYIQKIKKTVGKNLVIVTKPTLKSSYKATVDILDEMTINKIHNYSMAQLNPAEKKLFQTESFDFTPSEPVAVSTPGSVTTQQIPNDNAFIIVIEENNSVWYQPISPISRKAPQQVNPPVTKNLQSIIADYEASHTSIKISYLIKGNSKSSYTAFEQVIEALKNNKIYKYNLVTAEY